jgi:hypothetical protein
MSNPTIQNFIFGKLALSGKWEDQYAYNLSSLRSPIIEDSGKFKYGFFDPQELEFNSEKFVYCKLVKYKSRLEGEIVDERTHKVLEGGLDLGVVARSDYYLDILTGVIAFHPIDKRLSERQFRAMFARLFEAANHEFFIQAQIDLIDEPFKIQEAIQRFQMVNRISFDIHPTNPSASEIYRRLDERLKKLHAERIRTEIIAKEGGLNQEALSRDDASRAIAMAKDGYGKASVKGIVDNRNVTLTTGESPITKKVLMSGSPIDVLNQLFPIFLQIRARMAQ